MKIYPFGAKDAPVLLLLPDMVPVAIGKAILVR